MADMPTEGCSLRCQCHRFGNLRPLGWIPDSLETCLANTAKGVAGAETGRCDCFDRWIYYRGGYAPRGDIVNRYGYIEAHFVKLIESKVIERDLQRGRSGWVRGQFSVLKDELEPDDPWRSYFPITVRYWVNLNEETDFSFGISHEGHPPMSESQTSSSSTNPSRKRRFSLVGGSPYHRNDKIAAKEIWCKTCRSSVVLTDWGDMGWRWGASPWRSTTWIAFWYMYKCHHCHRLTPSRPKPQWKQLWYVNQADAPGEEWIGHENPVNDRVVPDTSPDTADSQWGPEELQKGWPSRR